MDVVETLRLGGSFPANGGFYFNLVAYNYYWEVAKGAHAAALVAAAEINQSVFEDERDLIATSRTWANAQAFASMNNDYLAQYRVNALVTGIAVNDEEDTVLVQVSANLDRLFSSVVPKMIVTKSGYAEIRAFTRWGLDKSWFTNHRARESGKLSPRCATFWYSLDLMGRFGQVVVRPSNLDHPILVRWYFRWLWCLQTSAWKPLPSTQSFG
jgi:hypothetical protein